MPYYLTNDELQHWGIKGQKWGLRRYQNEDGSLTEEGKERYGYKGDVRDITKKELAADRRKRIKAESQAIRNSKATNRQKAKALAKLGDHEGSYEHYAKDVRNKRNAMLIGGLAFSVAKSVGSKYLANKVATGEMSYNTAANLSSAIGLGRNLVVGYMTASTIDSAVKGSKEYWKPNK